MRPRDVEQVTREIIGEQFHAKQVLSLANGVSGVIDAAALGIHAIGRALATAQGLNPKHAIKQVDRLLSNQKLDLDRLFASWIPYVISGRPEALIALDWTEFQKDGHATIAAYLITSHGRATPLAWRSFALTELKDGGRTDAEDLLLIRLRECIPESTSVVLIADRGFADQELYKLLESWRWDFIVRMRKNIHVTNNKGEMRPAGQWLAASGRAKKLKGARVTDQEHLLGAVVVTRAKKMKEPWLLATSLSDQTATRIVKLYGRRFTIEETFRDQKDPRFGLGMNHVRTKSTKRRDRLLFLAALAQTLLTLLGAAGERAGLDRTLKSNTVKKRTLSLFRQGCFWFDAIPNMKQSRLRPLIKAFGELITEHHALSSALGII